MTAVLNLFKLRIGIVITWTALAAIAITPGPSLAAWQIAVLAVCVLISSASAGAFNQIVERDIDARMQRTRNRPFVIGTLANAQRWLLLVMALVATSVLATAYTLNPLSALYVFLGAFFYAVVYTVWLKRRTWLNIVIGGLSGSFAVLAGAAAVTPAQLPPEPLILAIVLFLWTPSHFWSLAMAFREDYVAAGVPMLPAVIGNERTSRVIFGNTVALVAVSLLPALYGAGWIYLAGAAIGGGWFLWKSYLLMQKPYRREAMRSFFASLVQLALLLSAAMIEAAVRS